jgi:hypothetical protein
MKVDDSSLFIFIYKWINIYIKICFLTRKLLCIKMYPGEYGTLCADIHLGEIKENSPVVELLYKTK